LVNTSVLCSGGTSLLSLLDSDAGLDISDGSFHFSDLGFYSGGLLGVFAVDDLEVALCTLPESLGVSERCLDLFGILKEGALHQAHSLHIAQLLAFFLDHVALVLQHIISYRVNLMKGIVAQGVQVVLGNFRIYLLNLLVFLPA
jgi:hypothetical protein